MTELERQAGGWIKGELLWKIEREHILRAIAELDAGAPNAFGPSTEYDLMHEGRAYAPKAVLGLAARHVLGDPLGPGDFSGGEDSTCFRVLRDRGFTVQPKPAVAPQRPRPNTWIFQGNPDQFDVDGYLSAGLSRISWSVRQASVPPRPGDIVYLWRSAGKTKGVAGVVARAVVTSDVWFGPEEEASKPFWREPPTSADANRVWLRVEKTAHSKEVLKRDWFLDDPICRDLLVVRRPAGTNFLVPAHHADRLDRLWRRTGVDWTRADCVAGLWAYDVTYGHEISGKADSPVAEVALRIGRAVGGVYNKVMNFRAIDPRDKRSGLGATAEMDRVVWSEFFDVERNVLRSSELEAAYAELWGDVPPPARTAPVEAEGSPTAPPPPPPGRTPARGERTIQRIVRDTNVTRWVKEIHDDTCQVCGVRLVGAGGPFSEGAHIRALGAENEGPDEVENVLCLCPNHHALFDRFGFYVEDDFRLVGLGDVEIPGHLRTLPVHAIKIEHLRYHRRVAMGGRGAALA